LKSVEGKVAFITGGASGIGFGMARAFLQAGMKVVVADLRKDHLERSAAEVGANANAHFVQLDVTDRSAMKAAADETEARFGKVHVLCNNAGVGVLGGAKLATYDDWDWGMGVNLGGVINGVQTFLPRILAHGEGGHIVNTSSVGAVLPSGGGIVYLAAKCAVMGMTEGLCAELAKDNIGVTLLCPGPTATNIHEVGQMRPERYRNSGFREIEADLAQRRPPSVWLDPLEVGQQTLDAIRTNRLFLITHNEFKAGAAERFEAILAGFPRGPVDPERVKALGFPVTTPLYAEILERDRKERAQ
jgi:NAD(P)-dependent dehydrogenase (short-subunit alcohol dehydrogenase family)